MGLMIVPSLLRQRAHVIRIDLQGFHGCHVKLLLLHEGMRDGSLLRRFEDGMIVIEPRPNSVDGGGSEADSVPLVLKSLVCNMENLVGYRVR
jgi:hypothetical protein